MTISRPFAMSAGGRFCFGRTEHPRAPSLRAICASQSRAPDAAHREAVRCRAGAHTAQRSPMRLNGSRLCAAALRTMLRIAGNTLQRVRDTRSACLFFQNSQDGLSEAKPIIFGAAWVSHRSTHPTIRITRVRGNAARCLSGKSAETCQAPAAKIFCFSEIRNCRISASSRPARGAVVRRHETRTWDAVDAAASGAGRRCRADGGLSRNP